MLIFWVVGGLSIAHARGLSLDRFGSYEFTMDHSSKLFRTWSNFFPPKVRLQGHLSSLVLYTFILSVSLQHINHKTN